MASASDLGRLEGKRIAQISFDGDIMEIVIEDVWDEYGNESDRNLRIVAKARGTGLSVSVW